MQYIKWFPFLVEGVNLSQHLCTSLLASVSKVCLTCKHIAAV